MDIEHLFDLNENDMILESITDEEIIEVKLKNYILQHKKYIPRIMCTLQKEIKDEISFSSQQKINK